jgi:hypothetical protein
MDAPVRTNRLADLQPAQLPPAPASTWHIVGPGIVAAGVGLASGEFAGTRITNTGSIADLPHAGRNNAVKDGPTGVPTIVRPDSAHSKAGRR